MKLYLIFNTDKLKLYYENVFTKQETYLEVVKKIKEYKNKENTKKKLKNIKIKKIRKKKETNFLLSKRDLLN